MWEDVHIHRLTMILTDTSRVCKRRLSSHHCRDYGFLPSMPGWHVGQSQDRVFGIPSARYSVAYGIICARVFITDQQDVLGVDFPYGLGALIISDVDAARPASVCHAHPLADVDISLVWTDGIDLAPARAYTVGFAVVAGQDDAGTELATSEFHVLHQHRVVESTDLSDNSGAKC